MLSHIATPIGIKLSLCWAHINFFEGAAHYTLSTNNALESHNATIKRKITYRRRLLLEEFLTAMFRMTCDISKQFIKCQFGFADVNIDVNTIDKSLT